MAYLPASAPSPAGRAVPRRARARAGITVMEVLIASTLLTFVVLASLAAISQGMTHTNHARMITLSSQVLQSAVEDLRLKNYSQIIAYAAQSQPVSLTSTIPTELLSSSFTRTMTLSASYTTRYTSSTTQFGLISVVLTVSWTEGNGTFRRTAITYFGEKGLTDYSYVGF